MGDTGSQRIGGTKQLLAEEVFRHIGAAIVSGRLAARDRIRDAELAVELHVSRTPVREALQRLERIGLVTMYPSRYTEVTEVTDEIVAASCEFAAFQSGFVARMAARRMNEDERVEVIALLDAAAGSGDPGLAAQLRRRLFSRLSELSGNTLQHRLMDEASLALARNLQHLSATVTDSVASDAYARLRAALRDGDEDAAEHAARTLHGCG